MSRPISNFEMVKVRQTDRQIELKALYGCADVIGDQEHEEYIIGLASACATIARHTIVDFWNRIDGDFSKSAIWMHNRVSDTLGLMLIELGDLACSSCLSTSRLAEAGAELEIVYGEWCETFMSVVIGDKECACDGPGIWTHGLDNGDYEDGYDNVAGLFNPDSPYLISAFEHAFNILQDK